MIVFDGGYVGLAPVPGGRVNVGIVLGRRGRPRLRADGRGGRRRRGHGGDPAGGRRSGRLAIARSAATRSRARRRSAHRVARRAGPDWLLVGDAAGFLDPFTGEGLHRALGRPALAADAIDRHLGGDPDAPRGLRPGDGRAIPLEGRRQPRSSRRSSAGPRAFDYAARRLAGRGRRP